MISDIFLQIEGFNSADHAVPVTVQPEAVIRSPVERLSLVDPQIVQRDEQTDTIEPVAKGLHAFTRVQRPCRASRWGRSG